MCNCEACTELYRQAALAAWGTPGVARLWQTTNQETYVELMKCRPDFRSAVMAGYRAGRMAAARACRLADEADDDPRSAGAYWKAIEILEEGSLGSSGEVSG